MQKQKTVAKWLAIILLCSVAVGSYVLYDALYVKKNDMQATADDFTSGDTTLDDNNVDDGDENGDDTVTPPAEHIPYYTTLPRPSEKIDGITVTHFGGEGDDTIQGVFNYSGKRYAVFLSSSTEFDVRENGLYVATIGDGVESVNLLSTTDTFVDGKMTGNGVTILTKNQDCGHLFLIGTSGDIRAKITLPNFTDGRLYFSQNGVLLFLISDGHITCNKLLDNMSLQTSPFTISTTLSTISQVFDSPLGQVLVLTEDDCVSICTYHQNTGFKLMFAQDKLCFRQLITAGTSLESNYILFGISNGQPLLVSFDQNFQAGAIKIVDDATDGFVFPSGDGLCFVGNGVSNTYCRHLDLVASVDNNFTFQQVKFVAPSFEGTLALVIDFDKHNIILADNEILCEKTLEYSCEIVGVATSKTGFSLLVNTTSTLDVFRGNFGKTDAYVLDFDFDFFYKN